MLLPQAKARERPSALTRRATTRPGSSSGRRSRSVSSPSSSKNPVGHLELGLDVRLPTRGAHRRRVALRAEQEPDGLGDDRLAGAGLTRERDEPGRELEVGLADQDEVLDPQTSKHTGIVDSRLAPHTCPFRSRSSRGSG